MEFVSCVKWVNQGQAKSQPDKINLDENELKRLIDEADSDVEKEIRESGTELDEFQFDNYDEEDDTLKAKLKDVATYNEVGKMNKNNDSDSDDDEIIKADDNLIIAGIVGEDESSLLIYICNDNDGDMYVHHDIMLSSAPLCVDYLHHKDNEHRNLCLIGSMDPVIEIWDLDIIGCVEPVFKLGKYKKGSKKNYGHTKSVLDIASNTNFPHVLASASVDKTVLLWDLSTGEVSTTMTQFKDGIQSIEWNFCEQYLLTGAKDHMVRNFDCRVYDDFQKWKLESSVEKVTWSTSNTFTCYAGTEQGYVYTIDIRNNKPLNHFQAHQKEVTGLISSHIFSKLLITCGTDEIFNIWDISKDDVNLLSNKNINSALQCMDVNPDLPYLVAVGGTSLRKEKLKVININTCIHKEDNVQTATCTEENLNTATTSSDTYNIPLLEQTIPVREKPKHKKRKLKRKRLNHKANSVMKKKYKSERN